MQVKVKNASFAMRHRAYRLAAGLSIVEVAKRIGADRSVVADWERGVGRPRWRMLAKVIRVLSLGLVVEPSL